jgi:hypothetical protein
MTLRILVSALLFTCCAFTVQASSVSDKDTIQLVKGSELQKMQSMSRLYTTESLLYTLQEDEKSKDESLGIIPCKSSSSWICWFI